ncbi:DegV family protein with EDD domain [Aequitasia blattaphilus]|uniref:DegV family protein n=1 Tax=Aequitasia blattaphilus TaxID=2949332 RepID=A0ABT1E739_9FIRM|nr:DegV family protein [Aequitasia blattaphilus]MCP1101648.1 DegV family protein [Aequitasia blattaphilus]MCR8614288.1 DegV family protein [Aequitasia blattaphilus]
MEKIAIVTDSNSGITQKEAKQLGIWVVPMPFTINGEVYFEDVTLSQSEFYQRLADDSDIHTSQPAVGDLIELWNSILESFDKIIHIPMSSGLSGSCETAYVLSQEFKGRVHVIDNQRISVTQKQSVLEAIDMVDGGFSAAEIEERLMKNKLEASIYIMVDTLKYLKKGGRITPAGAAIGTVLKIKPVLQIQGEKLDAFAKVRGTKSGKRIMLDAIEKDIMTRFSGEEVHMAIAHTCETEEVEKWVEEAKERFPDTPFVVDPLSLSVSCHIGPGALAIACTKKLK